MRFATIGITRWVAGLGLLLAGVAPGVRAAAAPVRIDLTTLRAIQTYAVEEKATDDAYLLVSGVAGGKEIQERLPKDKTLQAAAKTPAVVEKQPVEVWKGELADGQFVLLTVTLMQGKGADAARIKQFLDAQAAADQKVAERSKKTLSADDVKKLAADTLKAHREVITKIKDIFSRDAKTDHFGGQFTLIVLNDGGKLVKRLDPVGLTFGEHYGNDLKVYSKLKNTRNNVPVKEAGGEWTEQQFAPLSDDLMAARVKMLETEEIKGGPKPGRHVTDYLAEVQVRDLSGGGEGKSLKWKLGGEITGEDDIHTYWNFAE